MFDRYKVPTGYEITGPAVFEENESTFVIGPDAVCTADASGNLIVTLPVDES